VFRAFQASGSLIGRLTNCRSNWAPIDQLGTHRFRRCRSAITFRREKRNRSHEVHDAFYSKPAPSSSIPTPRPRCSSRAPLARGGGRAEVEDCYCLGTAPRRSLHCLIGDFVAKIIAFVGFVIHHTKSHHNAPHGLTRPDPKLGMMNRRVKSGRGAGNRSRCHEQPTHA
jgi:hypothetical protein